MELITPVIEWIDCELGEAYRFDFQCSHTFDVLLELRALFTEGASVNVMVRKFYRLLPKLQKNYYLMGYRIRQWVALHCVMRVSDPLERVESFEKNVCATLTTLEGVKKQFFEACDYRVNYHDIRLEIALR